MVWGGVIYFRLKVSRETLKCFANRISQLYEQGAEVGSVRADEDRIGEYVRHWCPSERRCRAGRWVRVGVAIQLKPFKVWEHRDKFPLHPRLFNG